MLLLLPLLLQKGPQFCSFKTLKMLCDVYHKVPKLWPIAYSNGLRQDAITMLLAPSLTAVSVNFSVP